MKIVCMNDQVFPLRDTDAEQTVSMMSAFTNAGADVTLLLPEKWGKNAATSQKIESYYEIKTKFKIRTVKSLYPSCRAIEKSVHGARGIASPSFKTADVIYTRNIPTALSVLLLCRKPVIYETYRPWPDQQKFLRPILRWMTRHRRFAGAVLHSKFAGSSFVKNGMPKEKLLVAYNGYDPGRMQPVLEKRTAREKLGLPAQSHIVTYVGRVDLEKGLDTVLDMAKICKSVHFVIVGSLGQNEVEKLAQPIPNVLIVPWQQFSRTTTYLYASDVLLIPPTASPLEKAGNTVLPLKTFFYMASKRPIFGPASKDLLEILENQKNAILVNTDNNLESICRELDNLLSNRTQQKLIGEQAARDIEPSNWDNRARKILQFIEQRI